MVALPPVLPPLLLALALPPPAPAAGQASPPAAAPPVRSPAAAARGPFYRPAGERAGADAAPANPDPASPDPVSYADIADLVLAAPVIADATVLAAARINGAEAAGLAPGRTRFYVTAAVGALLRGAAGLPPRIGYLVDAVPDARGRPPRLKHERVLLFARAVAGAADQLQLVAPDGQRPWTPALEARVRRIAAAALAADAPPVVTGVGRAFHAAGTLPGEGETQVFLATADRRPVSLTVRRRPGQPPRWAVALGEIVDEAAPPPAPGTLLWYRLACALPPALPPASTAGLEAADAAQASADYRLVVAGLGPCGRTRGPAKG